MLKIGIRRMRSWSILSNATSLSPMTKLAKSSFNTSTAAAAAVDASIASSNNTHYYFAIASMMNPTSLQARGLCPIQSQPAILLDYKLEFFGSMGFAEAISCKGGRFHGVVHTITDHDLEILTDMEGHLYKATKATAQLYDGSLLNNNVLVYCRPDQRLDNDQIGIPQERYIDIMVEGATHYGVDAEYIESLRQLEKQPRPKLDEFWSMGPVAPHLPVMSLEEAFQLDGEEGQPLAATVNGKVFHILNPTLERTGLFRKMRLRLQTPAVEDFVPKTLYDPMYGIPQNREECTRQHAAYLEHIVLNRLGKDGVAVIGSVPQTYKDG